MVLPEMSDVLRDFARTLSAKLCSMMSDENEVGFAFAGWVQFLECILRIQPASELCDNSQFMHRLQTAMVNPPLVKCDLV